MPGGAISVGNNTKRALPFPHWGTIHVAGKKTAPCG
jgi:hypothetical protein